MIISQETFRFKSWLICTPLLQVVTALLEVGDAEALKYCRALPSVCALAVLEPLPADKPLQTKTSTCSWHS